MLTPLADRDAIDVEGLQRLVERMLAGGVSGLFLLGTTGEGPSLSYHLRRELVDRVCRLVDGRVPVLVGVTDTSFVESVNLAEEAVEAGAQAVVLAAPFYYPAGQQELLGYVRRIAAAMPLPVLLYNMPSHTKIAFQVDTVRRLLEVPNIVGLKDSSAEMIYFHRLLEVTGGRPDFSLLMGPEELLGEAILSGAHGGVAGGANLAPELYVGLYRAAARGDLECVRQLHARVMQLAQAIYSVATGGAGVTRGLKTALWCLGVCSDRPAEPFDRLGPERRETIRRRLAALEQEVLGRQVESPCE